jgi:hypothetical protein
MPLCKEIRKTESGHYIYLRTCLISSYITICFSRPSCLAADKHLRIMPDHEHRPSSSMQIRQTFTGYRKVLIWLRIIRDTMYEHRLSIRRMFQLLNHLTLYGKVTSIKLKM